MTIQQWKIKNYKVYLTDILVSELFGNKLINNKTELYLKVFEISKQFLLLKQNSHLNWSKIFRAPVDLANEV
ncbi:unnamed protein product [Schistosoma margrebowiei]|uniref:Uncharacterized protein n=1 Tax=Schistosoma margrebowiei TaxID=48269 RepID=A0A183MCN2_9TREM|nr:unnamed protein product [Schistosoma margrebowiei]